MCQRGFPIAFFRLFIGSEMAFSSEGLMELIVWKYKSPWLWIYKKIFPQSLYPKRTLRCQPLYLFKSLLENEIFESWKAD